MNASPSRLAGLVSNLSQRLTAIPEDVLQVLGRFSIAAVFWKSGQTKVEGLVVDLVGGHFEFGVPHLSASAIDLFREEYHLPLIPPEIAAPLAATAEHLFPLLLLFGLATRLSALALLGMTAVIEIFVYPDAYPTHGVWATVLLFLAMRGGGRFALDRLLEKKFSLKL